METSSTFVGSFDSIPPEEEEEEKRRRALVVNFSLSFLARASEALGARASLGLGIRA